MMGWYGYGMGLGDWLLMVLFGVLVVALVGWLVLVTVVAPYRASHDGEVGAAERILDRRFAAGEIDQRTYTEQRAVLATARRG
jgi:uncharacterized membrane protein